MDSRKSCQRKLGGVERSEKRRYWKTGIQSIIRWFYEGGWLVLGLGGKIEGGGEVRTPVWWAVMAWARMLEKAEMMAVCTVAVTMGGAMAGCLGLCYL